MSSLDKTNQITGIAGNIIGGVQAAKQLFTNTKKEEARQDTRQVNMQGKLNEINSKTNKDLADYEQKLKLQMWKDTNYSAQLEQAGMAGLSKVAVLGGSGGGTQGASVNSGGVGSGASNSAQAMMANTQAELAKAQTANLNANTMKTTAETKKIGGIDTDKAGSEKDLIETTNIGKKLENSITALNLKIKNETIEEAKNSILADYQKSINDSVTSGIKLKIANATMQTEIDTIKGEYSKLLMETAAIKQGIEVDKAKIDDINSQIKNRLEQIKLGKEGLATSVSNMEAFTEAMLWSAGIQATGQVVKGITDIWTKKIPSMQDKNTRTTEWEGPKGQKYKETHESYKPRN
jgi:hypothetical protein